MPRFSITQTSFNAGELSPNMYGRIDVGKYASGAETISNFIVKEEGGLVRRSGTRFVLECADSAKKSRLIPFVFSTDQAYVLEFGDQVIRVFSDEVAVSARDNTFTVASNEVIFESDEFVKQDHGYRDGYPIRFTTDSADLPAPLVIDTTYYVSLLPQVTATDVDVTTEIWSSTGHGLRGDATNRVGPYLVWPVDDDDDGIAWLPTGVDAKTEYWIGPEDADTFKLYTAKTGGALVTVSAKDANTHYLFTPTADAKRDYFHVSTDGTVANIIDLADNGTGVHTSTATWTGNSGIVEIDSPYTEDELFEIQYVQSADVLFIVHANHPPMQLGRFSNTQWQLDEVVFEDGPYLSQNTTVTTMDLGTQVDTNKWNVAFSSTEGVNGGAGLSAGDLGRMVRIEDNTPTPDAVAWGRIIGIVSTTDFHMEPGVTWPAAPETTWRIGEFKEGNYPGTVSFFEQRLAFAGMPESPQTLHASRSGDFTHFGPTSVPSETITVQDTDSLNYTIGDNQVNTIVWLATARNLIMGTPGGVFPVYASTANEAVTPTNINVTKATSAGGKLIRAHTIDNRIVYVSRTTRKTYGLSFSFELDGFIAQDLTLLADHIAESGFTELDCAFEPDPIVYFVRTDGALAVMTFKPEQEVNAWAKWAVGGSFGTGNAVIESIAVVPSSDETHDTVYLSVKRTINGATKRYIEFVEDEFTSETAQDDAFFVDCGLTYSDPVTAIGKTTPVTNLDHLEGETVSVLADGGVHPDVTVTGGQITLNDDYNDIHVGLSYTSTFKSLRLNRPDPEGSSLGKSARLDHIAVRFLNSMGGKYGPSASQLDTIVLRDPSDPMDTAPPPFTGDIKLSFEGGFSRELYVVLEQVQPIPFGFLAMTYMGQEGSR